MISIDLKSRPRITVPEFSPEQMRDIGEFACTEELARISQGINVNDAPAKPLSPWYAGQKRRSGAQPIRDLRLTGAMLASRGVVEAETNEVAVAFTDGRQAARAARNERIEPMLGLSPASKGDLDAHVGEQFAESVRRAGK